MRAGDVIWNPLSGEKAMLVKARGVLVSELSFALNLSEDDALKKLEEQLA